MESSVRWSPQSTLRNNDLKEIIDDPLYWQGTEIDPRFCKISEKIFKLDYLKVLIKLSKKPKNEGPPTQGHVVIQLRKMNFKNTGD